MNTKPYIAVVYGELTQYWGKSETRAAVALEPGTHFGRGATKESALEAAHESRRHYESFLETRKEAA